MSADFVLDIISKNWFQEVDPLRPRVWAFEESVATLSARELQVLVELYFDCFDLPLPSPPQLAEIVRAVQDEKEYSMRDLTISKAALARLLHAVTLSEYRLDSLLYHAPEVRAREVEQYAGEIGIEPDILRRIYLNWHRRVRDKHMAPST